jgi:hypothetical protein
MSERKCSPSEVGWTAEDIMEDKWLVFEKVFKYISRVSYVGEFKRKNTGFYEICSMIWI